MAEYIRVIPRDLFNEAKLLKSMGRLCLLIHDGLVPAPMEVFYEGEEFEIVLDDEGSLRIRNIQIKVKDIFIIFKTTYNSKSIYPFYAECDNVDYLVFDSEGNFDEEFLGLVNIL